MLSFNSAFLKDKLKKAFCEAKSYNLFSPSQARSSQLSRSESLYNEDFREAKINNFFSLFTLHSSLFSF